MRELAILATGRERSLFADDMAARHDQIADAIAGKRVLVIGGAGSIGGATLRELLRSYGPVAAHVVDHDENGLAELARDLRGGGLTAGAMDLRLMPLDYGATVTQQFLRRAGPYDIVLHFAALKHVRSEKDPASILHVLDTNVLKQQRLLEWLAQDGAPARYFSVSTDKAANPVNFMGASKRLMEHLLFTEGLAPIPAAVRTSARFANVAFSAGSLLESFARRLDRGQPLAVPRDTRRYFVSLEESAHICLLACTVFPSGTIAVPRLREDGDMRDLIPIAESFLRTRGYEPVLYDDEAAAGRAVATDSTRGRWPLLHTPRDTDGEKAYEEFAGVHESPAEIGLEALLAIAQSGADPAALRATLTILQDWVDDPSANASREDIARALRGVIPEFQPVTRGRSLDDRR
ncbi:MAG TPA: polysaccharide biosynthesis protein [Gemmatimonadaceae bacterium]|nr:polysaccharide biosynthesis protein [Gemmatimonadaceae bacterium]